MKALKNLDQTGQVLMVVLGVLYTITSPYQEVGTFIWIYFLTGGWQLASFIIHFFANGYTWYNRKQRLLYGKTLIWIGIAGILALVTAELSNGALPILFLGAALFITPGFAIWYFTIGLSEIQTIKQKELIHLK